MDPCEYALYQLLYESKLATFDLSAIRAPTGELYPDLLLSIKRLPEGEKARLVEVY